MEPGALLAVQTRGGRVETVHTGHAAVLAPGGTVVAAWGDPGTATYWRSAAKPLQAAVVVRTGAWDAFGLDEEALSVACGSHAGEAAHRSAVGRILVAIGSTGSELRCGIHAPWSRHTQVPDAGPDAFCNNCSGKHAAMLAACRHMGWDLDYLRASHPLHAAIMRRIMESTGTRPGWAVDGCGVPTWHTSIHALADSFRRLLDDPAGARVLAAMRAHPLMVAGTDQFCTDLGLATRGHVAGKYGALGVFVAHDDRTGESLALKVASGHEAAAKAAAGGVMVARGWLTEEERMLLSPHLEVVNRNHAGVEVGSLTYAL